MEVLLSTHKNSLIYTIIIIVALYLLQFILRKTAQRVGSKADIHIARIQLMNKYISVFTGTVAIFLLALVWGVEARDVTLVFSSVFAIIGVALFAFWSVLSNITAGVILFFSFPYRIGNRIKIHDKDLPVEAVIEDIRAFHLHLRTAEGELITYPNNLILQKAVSLIKENTYDDEGKDAL